jgi:3-methylfumaryl-CoA hydratase
MWAGGEINFVEPLRVGDAVTRSSTIKDVTIKTGSTGALCFVSVDHAFATQRGPAVRERHDIVYRDMPKEEGHGDVVRTRHSAHCVSLPRKKLR